MTNPGDPLSSSKQPKNWDFGSKMAIKLIFWPFWASEWVPLRLKGLQKDRVSHGIALDTPHAHILKRKKNWPKMRYQKLGFGVHNGRKNDFFAVLSLWVGPFRLKRSQKDRASHGIALDTPHAYILKKKIGQKRDPQIWDLGSGMAQKWSKTIQMPIICMKSSYLTNYYPHFIDFKMLRLIWTKMAETP